MVEEEAVGAGLEAEAAVGALVEVVARVRVRVHLHTCREQVIQFEKGIVTYRHDIMTDRRTGGVIGKSINQWA